MLSDDQLGRFEQNGYVVVPAFLSEAEWLPARERFEALFRGEFETGLQPDEWNWREGRDGQDLSRQICNGWKSDRQIARLVLSRRVGECCARLMGWPGTRLNQDNVIWKPPGAKPLGFHQDESYQEWIEPSSMVSCWMALDDTSRDGGPIEYATGSHRWPVSREKFPFHAPEDYREGLRRSAEALGIADARIERMYVKAGDVVFHHGRTWHGSGTNTSNKPRRSLVAHCMSSESRFHPTRVGPVYGRYKKFGSDEMEESFFPILWRQDGYRSGFLDRGTTGVGS